MTPTEHPQDPSGDEERPHQAVDTALRLPATTRVSEVTETGGRISAFLDTDPGDGQLAAFLRQQVRS